VKLKKYTEYGIAEKKIRVIASVSIVSNTAVNKHHTASPSTKHVSQMKLKIYVKLNSVTYRTVKHEMNKKNSVQRQKLQWTPAGSGWNGAPS
jgi:hypothetical protein